MSDSNSKKKEYNFGGIKEFNLEEIEAEVLNDSVYLDVFAGSDRVFKKDVRALTDVLSKITQLDGVSYLYKADEFPEYSFSTERQIGFIAQGVEQVFPEVVKRDEHGKLMVNYGLLTPVLVEGVKELSGQVERQQRQIDELKAQLNQVMATLGKASEDDEETRSV